MMTTINDRAHTALAVNITVRAMLMALDSGYDVVLDERNLYGPEWTVFSFMAQRHKHNVRFQYVKAKPEECKERCLSAGGSTAQCMEIDRLWEVYRTWLEKK